jgi:hypothetical protein
MSIIFAVCPNVNPSRGRVTVPTVTIVFTSTSGKKLDYRPVNTTIEAFVSLDLFAPSATFDVVYVYSTWPGFVQKARRVPMRILGGRRISLVLRFERRRRRKNSSMSGHSFEKSRSERRKESANGAVSVDVAVDSCEGGIGDEVGADAGVKKQSHFLRAYKLHLHGVRDVSFLLLFFVFFFSFAVFHYSIPRCQQSRSGLVSTVLRYPPN